MSSNDDLRVRLFMFLDSNDPDRLASGVEFEKFVNHMVFYGLSSLQDRLQLQYGRTIDFNRELSEKVRAQTLRYVYSYIIQHYFHQQKLKVHPGGLQKLVTFGLESGLDLLSKKLQKKYGIPLVNKDTDDLSEGGDDSKVKVTMSVLIAYYKVHDPPKIESIDDLIAWVQRTGIDEASETLGDIYGESLIDFAIKRRKNEKNSVVEANFRKNLDFYFKNLGHGSYDLRYYKNMLNSEGLESVNKLLKELFGISLSDYVSLSLSLD